MLYSINQTKPKLIQSVPHLREFNAWMKKLSPTDHEAISDELNSRIDGSDIHTSSWIPGEDWTGTPFQLIYIACVGDPGAAAMFFGLILYDLMIKRSEAWTFGRYDKGGVPIKGLTYFKLHTTP